MFFVSARFTKSLEKTEEEYLKKLINLWEKKEAEEDIEIRLRTWRPAQY